MLANPVVTVVVAATAKVKVVELAKVAVVLTTTGRMTLVSTMLPEQVAVPLVSVAAVGADVNPVPPEIIVKLVRAAMPLPFVAMVAVAPVPPPPVKATLQL